MENLAHSLTGVILARAGLKKHVPLGTVALVFVANAPDLDSVAGFWGQLYYFHHHRGITHSLLGTALLVVLFSSVLWLAGRKTGPPGAFPFVPLLAAVSLTAATHPLLDYTNSYGWKPFLPFSDHWLYGDLVFIIDPYLWLLLGGAVYLNRKPGWRTAWLWLAGVGILSWLIVRFSSSDPTGPWLTGIWVAGILLIAAAKFFWGRFHRRILFAALAGLAAYWGLLFLFHQHAETLAASQISDRYPRLQGRELSALPRPATPFEWDIFLEEETYVYYGRISIWDAGGFVLRSFPRNTELPLVQAASRTCPGQVMSQFARFEVFELQESVGDGPVESTVIIRDLRFTRSSDSGFGVYRLPLDANGQPVISEACP